MKLKLAPICGLMLMVGCHMPSPPPTPDPDAEPLRRGGRICGENLYRTVKCCQVL